MKRSTFEALVAEMENRLAREDEKKSTGSNGKRMDVLTRDRIMPHGITRKADVRCRAAALTDCYWHGRRVEIKTGSGAVAYDTACRFTKEDCTAENVLHGASIVVWYPFPLVPTFDPFEQGWVFTRAQFIACLEAIGKNGLQSSLKISKQGGQINIQTLTAKMQTRLWDVLENMPTVAEYNW